MKILITGANGFLGKHLRFHLNAINQNIDLVFFTRNNDIRELPSLLKDIDLIFHFAGVNRSVDPNDFLISNIELTRALVNETYISSMRSGKSIKIIFTSSIQAGNNSNYGNSKLKAEELLRGLNKYNSSVYCYIFRLPNVFGRWCRPNYNSMIATFCHNIAKDLPIEIHNHESPITITYVDNVIDYFIRLITENQICFYEDSIATAIPCYQSTVGDIVRIIYSFKKNGHILNFGSYSPEMIAALYSTYESYKNS